jgi:hypothetical protein
MAGGGHDVIRRAPMVHSLVNGKLVDAADWDVAQIDDRLDKYAEAASYTRTDYNAGFNFRAG